MDFSLHTETLIFKIKSIISSVYGTIMCSLTFPSSMQIPIALSNHYPGLKTLIYSFGESTSSLHNPTHPKLIIHSCMLPSPQPLPSPTRSSSYSTFCSLALDDLMETESGVHMISSEEEIKGVLEKSEVTQGKRSRQRRRVVEREYPPPISSLARIGYLRGHMPRNLRREYVDGRLLLVEEKVKHYKYFETKRENGRLILNLVTLHETGRCFHVHYIQEDKIEQEDEEYQEIPDPEGDVVADNVEVVSEKQLTLASSVPRSSGCVPQPSSAPLMLNVHRRLTAVL